MSEVGIEKARPLESVRQRVREPPALLCAERFVTVERLREGLDLLPARPGTWRAGHLLLSHMDGLPLNRASTISFSFLESVLAKP